MKVKVLVNGAFGRMGQMVTKAVTEDSELELVGQTGREYDLKRAIIDSGAQVVVDFTTPESVYANTITIIEAGASPVVGTSGLKKEQIEHIKTLCEQLRRGGVIVPNFSMGAILMIRCAEQIARYFPQVEIIEMHHEKKVDSPSGTAIATAEQISHAHKEAGVRVDTVIKGIENLSGARGAAYEEIAIHSVRLPGILAKQMVIFGGEGETLTISHESIQRESFMPGVRFACKKVMSMQHLAYGLQALL
jgi:4-hydroxy-tetrahydrodipicolinate reductase